MISHIYYREDVIHTDGILQVATGPKFSVSVPSQGREAGQLMKGAVGSEGSRMQPISDAQDSFSVLLATITNTDLPLM